MSYYVLQHKSGLFVQKFVQHNLLLRMYLLFQLMRSNSGVAKDCTKMQSTCSKQRLINSLFLPQSSPGVVFSNKWETGIPGGMENLVWDSQMGCGVGI